jgi:DNA-binding MarR family transcriptional regulator
MSTKEQLITEEASERRYYTMIPNMIDDMGLSPFAYRLYGHFRRVAGEAGGCWQSVTTLAAICQMSRGMVSRCRQELEEAGLINVTRTDNPHGGRDYITVTVKDIWLLNTMKYASSPHEHASSQDELASSPGGLKNNNIKNKQNKQAHNSMTAAIEYSTPSADSKERYPSQAQDSETAAYLEYVSLLYGVELTDQQRERLIKLHRRHARGFITRKGIRYELNLNQLYEATRHYKDGIDPFNDALVIRIGRAALNWRVSHSRMTLEDWIRQIG